jgi:hypothetical protein
MLYSWKSPEHCPNRLIAAYDDEISTDRFVFLEGIRLKPEQVDKPIIFDHEMKQVDIIKYDCIPNNSSSPLVNQKIVDLLLQLAPKDVQFFNAEVRCKDGILTEYKLLNIASTIVGIDYEKSVCQMMKDYPTVILGFKYVTYKPGCMGSHKIARDAEYLSNILVSEDMKQVFEKEKVKGAWLVRPEEWYSLASGYEAP